MTTAFTTGSVVADFRIESVIGGCAMGTVYHEGHRAVDVREDDLLQRATLVQVVGLSDRPNTAEFCDFLAGP